MRQAVDSSVAIAALIADHEAHEQAEEALLRCDATIAHVAFETYSVLTRLPAPHRLEPLAAAELVEARLPGSTVTLEPDAHAAGPRRLADASVAGGASYDGLIALTALENDVRLISRDRRAARAYRALGVAFDLLP